VSNPKPNAKAARSTVEKEKICGKHYKKGAENVFNLYPFDLKHRL